MEKIISNDLEIDIDQIRRLPWDSLEKLHDKKRQRPFRPKDMFISGGNINLAEGREMGMTSVNFRNYIRKVAYKIKCLRKNKKPV